MQGRLAPAATGAAALLALATVAPSVPFTLPEPLSPGHAALVTAFVLTLPFVLWTVPLGGAGAAAHLAVTGVALALHPMTLLGGDGTTAALAAHFFLVLWRGTSVAAFLKLAATSFFQVHAAEWRPTLRSRGLDPSAFDPELAGRLVLEGCRTRGVDCLDLLPDMREACREPCYLPGGDMHWNERGHAAAAAALARALRSR